MNKIYFPSFVQLYYVVCNVTESDSDDKERNYLFAYLQ